ncbi:MAG: family 78 glycoside hydrolase catalytic domain [Eubacteriales bacterium]|nr:family 78 glycoside hydrolase catalytic domain [Eubacteriales bacterium]
MQIYDTKVNHLRNPLGFRMTRTSFSWKVREAKGTRQQAARIRIAGDAAMEQILFDSGWDEAASSLGYRAQITLAPRTRYYWTVSVRTDADEEETCAPQFFETGKRDEAWEGRWITCDSTGKRHPFFEKEIAPQKVVASARLYVCGLGLYELFYNGERIGDEYFTPYSNDYNEWVQYQTYDVTRQLQEDGTLSVLLGNGWYKARFGFTAREDIGFYGNEWKLIAELRLVYEDGSEEVIGTDESWRVRRSRIAFSNLYDGEKRDDTLPELPTEKAVFCEPPKGALTDRMSLPVTVHEVFEPQELLHTPAGELVFDMGQEFTGIFSLRVHEPAGTVIHVQTGEILQGGNFYNENLRSAKSEYIYISDGSEQTIVPHFTYYGYRYVKVEGIPGLKKEDFRGWALYSDFDRTGQISTGHDLVNRFIRNVEWGLKSNFLDVPTDCPQRDERMGWTGDAQVFSPTATYLEDTYAFYAKYLYDMDREQSVLDGKVPDVVPSCGVESCACVWGDAACIMPWNLYLFYGDRSILEDQFASMKGWVDYVRKVDGDNHGWRYVFHYGDWLALDNPAGGAEQVMGGTDEEFIANLYYAVSAGLVAKAAAVLGDEAARREYQALSDEQFAVVRREYYSVTGRCCIKTQTALLLTLKYHLSDNEELVREQLRKLFELSGGKLRTGFVGTPLMCNILSDNGMSDLAYTLLLNEEYPGWLREVKLGATTVWERWNSLLDDGTISGISMNSMNHYAYGSVLEWMFRHAAGLNTRDDAPGVRTVDFVPTLHWDLRRMEASYDSASGEYGISWELPDPRHVTIRVRVPFGAAANLHLPLAPESVEVCRSLTPEQETVSAAETGGAAANAAAQQDNRTDAGKSSAAAQRYCTAQDGFCVLEPGVYEISYELTRSVRKEFTVDTPIRELKESKEVQEKLAGIVPLDQIPTQYAGYSLREVSKKFGGRMDEESLDRLDAMLRGI